MKNDLTDLDIQINNLKETLYLLIKGGSLTDETVVRCSEKLDKLILEYQRENHFG
ncbi:Spo0E family sporulation regulatory protein-aspartic acid phosphatase [Clostridium sp. JNZ X4-2]